LAELTQSDGHDRIVRANGVDLCVETFGDPADAAILLIMGSGASMDWWRDEFCQRLAAGSRLVVRYDLRDTGRSVSYEPGAPAYTGDDLVEDAAGLIDSLGLRQAHLVGMSMGGGFAQLVALDHPDRVSSLTLIATSPAVPGEADRDLPSMTQQAQAEFAAIAEPDWADRDAVVDYIVAFERACAGANGFDEAEWRELAGHVFDRTTNIRSGLTNHDVLSEDDRPRAPLSSLKVPTLVIHGTEDPLFPLAHGLALAEEIRGARMLPVEGMGHEVVEHDWGVIVPAILEHTSGQAER
jgi:pimeloyl-ACP methyl ester carboxylesterase